jgi:hypothetical protein
MGLLSVLFHDREMSSLRIYAAVFHFTSTFFLLWTRIDCINNHLSQSGQGRLVESDYQYSYQEASYLGYIYTGIIFIIINFLVFLFKGFQDGSFSSVMQLFLDVCGTFFCAWISLDGLDWHSYISVWIFCAFLPFMYNLFKVIVVLMSETQTPWTERNTNTLVRSFHNAYMGVIELYEAILSAL